MPVDRVHLIATATLAAVLLLPAGVAQNFDDGQYHQLILNDWDTAEIDVLVLPPVAADAFDRLEAVEKSIHAWSSGIQELGEPWLASGLVINSYTVGQDVIPTSALQDPEIVVVSGEVNPFLLFGIGLAGDTYTCNVFPWLSLETTVELPHPSPGHVRTLDVHQHEQSPWSMTMLGCDQNVPDVCLVLNTNFAATATGQHRMYDLNAHEFGHCLGIGHVGDALDFSSTAFPEADIMSYQFDPAQVHCVSNLNVQGVQGTFAEALGRPSSEWLAPFDFIHMDPADYEQVDCANP